MAWLATRMTSTSKNFYPDALAAQFSKCDDCTKPDIYLVILDEYAGNTELKELLHFDNAGFENELTKRGFLVIGGSSSNYNSTPYSIASTLNMDYLDLNKKTQNPGNLDYCYNLIMHNRVINFLTANGYTFYNYSIFDFPRKPSPSYDNLLPNNTKLITEQTFTSRITKDIKADISLGKIKMKWVLKKMTYSTLDNNENFIRLTENITSRGSSSPRFVYTHLMMPHSPFFFNSKGQAQPPDTVMSYTHINKHNYIEYLQYCNKRVLELVDRIIDSSHQPPILLLLGDHGFRNIESNSEKKYLFMNLNAVYLPSKKYTQFYNGMTNVNEFRILLNEQFEQKIPLLKDSVIYLW